MRRKRCQGRAVAEVGTALGGWKDGVNVRQAVYKRPELNADVRESARISLLYEITKCS